MKHLAGLCALVGMTLALPPACPAQDGYPSSPKALVEQYARLDALAAGISAETWPELGQYTTFPQAPKWDAFVVIERYEIGKVLEGHTRAQVRMTYYPLGKLSDKFIPGTQPETVVFFINKVKDQWKVDSPALMPHVSYDVMKRRLGANSAANPKEKAANDALLAQIESVRRQAK